MVMVVVHGRRRRRMKGRWWRIRHGCWTESNPRGVQAVMVMMGNGGGHCRVMSVVYGHCCANFVPQDPRDTGYRWHVVLVANAVGQQTIAYLPGKYPRILHLQLLYVLHDFWRCYARLAAANCTWQNTAGFVVP